MPQTDSNQTKVNGACCTPTAVRKSEPDPVSLHVGRMDPGGSKTARFAQLPGGTFLMGTDNPEGFPLDGEGPVRSVTLNPFSIDIYPVTNEAFSLFVKETGYR